LAAVRRVAAPGQPVLGDRLVPGRDHRLLRQPGGAAAREHRPAVRRRQAPAADASVAQRALRPGGRVGRLFQRAHGVRPERDGRRHRQLPDVRLAGSRGRGRGRDFQRRAVGRKHRRLPAEHRGRHSGQPAVEPVLSRVWRDTAPGPSAQVPAVEPRQTIPEHAPDGRLRKT